MRWLRFAVFISLVTVLQAGLVDIIGVSRLNIKVEDGGSMVVQFDVSGEVFVTADKRETADPRGLELYKKAEASIVPSGPKFVIQPEAIVSELPQEKIHRERPPKKEEVAVVS